MVRVGPRAGHGSVLHARHVDADAGRRARRGRPDGLQPQPRHLARVLRPASSRRGPTTIGSRRSRACGRPASPSAAAASSAWARIGGVRYRLLQQLASLDPHPESVPINLLVRVEGTPLADLPPEDPLELVRTIATARILMPASFVRLSAGPAVADRRSAGALFPGRRELRLPRRPAADDAEPGREPRRAAARASSACASPRARAPPKPAPRSCRLTVPGRSTTGFARASTALERRRPAPNARPPVRRRSLVERLPAALARIRRRRVALRRGRAPSGGGSTGSRLLRGERESFARVERRFARFKGTERSLYFSSGYLANLAVLTTLPETGDVIFSDERNHASLIDGVRLSRATRRCSRTTTSGRSAAAGDGATPRTGRSASSWSSRSSAWTATSRPLADYAAVCAAARRGADRGRGARRRDLRRAGQRAHRGRRHWSGGVRVDQHRRQGARRRRRVRGRPGWAIDYLIQRARPFVFSTAPPPAVAEALEASLDLIEAEPERRRRAARARPVRARAPRRCRDRRAAGTSQIVPVVIGDNDGAVRVAAQASGRGFDVRAIRPPSVPAGHRAAARLGQRGVT